MEQIIPFSRPYPCRYGSPVLSSVDPLIFTIRYFTYCMQCTFCNDHCCSYGVSASVLDIERILARADALEAYVGVQQDGWFEQEWEEEPDYPGGFSRRTVVTERGCIFLNPRGRGCMLHAYALEHGMDYHELKPIICAVFPCAVAEGGVLCTMDEIEEHSVICTGSGPTVYEGTRSELAYYWGEALVGELDAIQRSLTGPAPRGLPLPPSGTHRKARKKHRVQKT